MPHKSTSERKILLDNPYYPDDVDKEERLIPFLTFTVSDETNSEDDTEVIKQCLNRL